MKMVTLNINYKKYKVMDHEFPVTQKSIDTLIIHDNVGYYERISSLIIELSSALNYSNALFAFPSHGGFLPIQCAPHLKHLYLLKCGEHNNNIKYNMNNHKISNMYLIDDIHHVNDKYLNKLILYSDTPILYDEMFQNISPIIISRQNIQDKKMQSFYNYHTYQLKNTDLCVFIPEILNKKFMNEFSYFLEEPNILAYDNLINLCIMVKNGGKIFEDMLEHNKQFIDRWTILDTGSTDNTVENIKRILKNKKGNLFQEPFINFGESRNRCLELAGVHCKYNMMLDDSYVVNGNLRDFLLFVRGDQYADSYSMYIKQMDIEYCSNRIFKSVKNLKYLYSIHEVIQDYDNVNILVPKETAFIYDIPDNEMILRSADRKRQDVVMLENEIAKNPDDPRSYYYLAQTYSFLKEHELAYENFIKRGRHPVDGFIQEKYCAFLEAGRLANFTLNKPWEECEMLYKAAFEIDNERPEALYFMGSYYYTAGNLQKAYELLLKGFEIGYPGHRQYCLLPTLSFQYLPKLLAECCYKLEMYDVGQRVSEYFLKNNKETAENYNIVCDLNKIHSIMNMTSKIPMSILPLKYADKPLCVFVVYGGFSKWTGKDILTKGLGGSETYIIEMSKYIQSFGHYQVIVFCDCEKTDVFQNVEYKPFQQYYLFAKTYEIDTCFISRYSEFLPFTIKSHVQNINLLVHDLTMTGIIIPMDKKLKNVFCLTEWHRKFFLDVCPELKEITRVLSHGIHIDYDDAHDANKKIPYKFIYSSMANRGLLQLLMMWTKIHFIEPRASLHIYTDLDGEFINNSCPDIIKQIRYLIEDLKRANVHYHGFVDKKTLHSSWKTADVWFYPCVFKETFCLTALEAAASKTLAITTDLAGLNETVGRRGILLNGQPNTTEWFDYAIETVFRILKEEKNKKQLVESNFKWVSKLTWLNQAKRMVNEFMSPMPNVVQIPNVISLQNVIPNVVTNTVPIPNVVTNVVPMYNPVPTKKTIFEPSIINKQLEYKGMYNWTNDIPVGSKNIFENVIKYFNNKNITNPKILEVGTYAGTSLIHIVELIPNSIGVGIDIWKNYDENGVEILKNIEQNNMPEIFLKNINIAGLDARIRGFRQDSTEGLLNMIKIGSQFDFVYVDGSHKLLNVYSDLILSWALLNKGGIMGMDDYEWNKNDVLGSPRLAIDHFLNKYENEITVLHIGYRVFIEKK